MFTSVFLSSPFIFIRLKLLKNSLNSRFFVTLLTKQCCSLHFVLLTVQPQSIADAQVPTIVEDPNQSVLIGSNVTFNCTAAVRTRSTIMNKGQRFISLWIQPQSRNYSKRIKVFLWQKWKWKIWANISELHKTTLEAKHQEQHSRIGFSCKFSFIIFLIIFLLLQLNASRTIDILRDYFSSFLLTWKEWRNPLFCFPLVFSSPHHFFSIVCLFVCYLFLYFFLLQSLPFIHFGSVTVASICGWITFEASVVNYINWVYRAQLQSPNVIYHYLKTDTFPF